MKHSVFVVDDHPVIRMGYAFLIAQEEDLEVCGEAGSALEALHKIRSATPEVVLVDISLGDMNGLELTKRLLAQHPGLAIVIISTHDELLYGERALLAGARGYIMKSEAAGVIVEALRRVLRGGYCMSEQMSDKIIQHFQQRGESLPAEEVTLRQFSDRELEIYELIGRGYNARQIAEMLLLSPKTIEVYRSRIRKKLAVDTLTELKRRAVLWVERRS
jgi:DNA-binding NarL/FixJ family response regulator